MNIPIIYVAHPFGGDKSNLDKAVHWCAFLSINFSALFVAPWIPLCLHWSSNGEALRRGQAMDLAAVAACDGLIAVGGQMSTGMRKAYNCAVVHAARKSSHVIDMTRFCDPAEMEADRHTMGLLSGLYYKAEKI